MAATYDNSGLFTKNFGTNATVTQAFTTSGANVYLFVFIYHTDNSDDYLVNVTFHGVGLSWRASDAWSGLNRLSFWALNGADSGTYDVVITRDPSAVYDNTNISFIVGAYRAVHPSGQPADTDAGSNAGATSSMASSVTAATTTGVTYIVGKVIGGTVENYSGAVTQRQQSGGLYLADRASSVGLSAVIAAYDGVHYAAQYAELLTPADAGDPNTLAVALHEPIVGGGGM